MWEEIEVGFRAIELIQSIGSSAINIAKGDVFFDLLNKLGVPTSASDVSLYSPVDAAGFIIKSYGDSANNNYLAPYFENRAQFYSDNTFDYSNFDLENQLTHFRNNNMLWQAESLIRRYENYNPEKDPIRAKGVIDAAIQYLNDQDEIEKAKKNPTAKFLFNTQSQNPLLIYISENNEVSFRISMNLTGYYDYTYGIKYKLLNIDNKELIKSVNDSYCSLDDDVGKVNRQCTGFITFDSNTITANSQYVLVAYQDNLINDKVLSKKYLKIKNKKNIEVTSVALLSSQNLDDDGNYDGEVKVQFNGQEIPYVTYVLLNGVKLNYGNRIYIPKEDFYKPALANLKVEIHPITKLKDTYSVSNNIHYLDLKSDIDKLLANQSIEAAASLNIIKVNSLAVNNESTVISIGDDVTFTLPKKNVERVFLSGLNGECVTETSTELYHFTCIYNQAGTFQPSVKIQYISSCAILPSSRDNSRRQY